MDHFQRLGLPRRFSVDAGELEQAYLARSRLIHPDYHRSGSDAELAASTDLSAAVNQAYNTLRDPFARAEYLLGLEGGPTAGEHRQLPPAFLAEMLEAREQVEGARGNPAAVARLDAEFTSRLDGLLADVGGAFARFEQLPAADPQRANLLAGVRGLLNAVRYVRRLLDDLHAD